MPGGTENCEKSRSLAFGSRIDSKTFGVTAETRLYALSGVKQNKKGIK
jgi:hypothetical protein